MQKDGFVYSREGERVQIVKYAGNLYDVEVPAIIDGLSVTSIGTAAFQNNPNVRRVKLPLTVKEIGDWAFSYMDALEAIELSLGVEKIGADAFTGSKELWEIRVPKSVNEIGINAFDVSTGIKICVAEASETSTLLQQNGYQVFAENECREDSEVLDRWAIANLTIGTACDIIPAGTTTVSSVVGSTSNIDLIRIPDNMTSITEDLLINAGSEIILIIPPSVTEIDEVIISGRTVTIVGDTDTIAESFAREHNLKFIVRVNTWLGY